MSFKANKLNIPNNARIYAIVLVFSDFGQSILIFRSCFRFDWPVFKLPNRREMKDAENRGSITISVTVSFVRNIFLP